jgi:glycosyltransferase involved in cell wall biosynthesis
MGFDEFLIAAKRVQEYSGVVRPNSMQMKKLSLSIIMPALNEELNIREAVNSSLESMKNHAIDGDVIVVNDGSTDRTGAIVEDLMKWSPSVKLVNHDRPRGIGYSFYDGVKHSDKDVVVMFPGDNENDPNDALAFIGLLQNVDLLVPFIHNVEFRDRKRRLISAVYRFIINTSFGVSLTYTNGTVFYRRCVLSDIELKSAGFFYQAELLIRVIRKGYLYAEVPNFLLARSDGRSKATTLSSLRGVMWDYLWLAFAIHLQRIEAVKDYRRLNQQSVSFPKIQRMTLNTGGGTSLLGVIEQLRVPDHSC